MGIQFCASVLIGSGKSKERVDFWGDEVQNLARVDCSYLPKTIFIWGLGHNGAWFDGIAQHRHHVLSQMPYDFHCACASLADARCTKTHVLPGVMSVGNAGGSKLVLRTAGPSIQLN